MKKIITKTVLVSFLWQQIYPLSVFAQEKTIHEDNALIIKEVAPKKYKIKVNDPRQPSNYGSKEHPFELSLEKGVLKLNSDKKVDIIIKQKKSAPSLGIINFELEKGKLNLHRVQTYALFGVSKTLSFIQSFQANLLDFQGGKFYDTNKSGNKELCKLGEGKFCINDLAIFKTKSFVLNGYLESYNLSIKNKDHFSLERSSRLVVRNSGNIFSGNYIDANGVIRYSPASSSIPVKTTTPQKKKSKEEGEFKRGLQLIAPHNLITLRDIQGDFNDAQLIVHSHKITLHSSKWRIQQQNDSTHLISNCLKLTDVSLKTSGDLSLKGRDSIRVDGKTTSKNLSIESKGDIAISGTHRAKTIDVKGKNISQQGIMEATLGRFEAAHKLVVEHMSFKLNELKAKLLTFIGDETSENLDVEAKDVLISPQATLDNTSQQFELSGNLLNQGSTKADSATINAQGKVENKGVWETKRANIKAMHFINDAFFRARSAYFDIENCFVNRKVMIFDEDVFVKSFLISNCGLMVGKNISLESKINLSPGITIAGTLTNRSLVNFSFGQFGIVVTNQALINCNAIQLCWLLTNQSLVDISVLQLGGLVSTSSLISLNGAAFGLSVANTALAARSGLTQGFSVFQATLDGIHHTVMGDKTIFMNSGHVFKELSWSAGGHTVDQLSGLDLPFNFSSEASSEIGIKGILSSVYSTAKNMFEKISFVQGLLSPIIPLASKYIYNPHIRPNLSTSIVSFLEAPGAPKSLKDLYDRYLPWHLIDEAVPNHFTVTNRLVSEDHTCLATHASHPAATTIGTLTACGQTLRQGGGDIRKFQSNGLEQLVFEDKDANIGVMMGNVVTTEAKGPIVITIGEAKDLNQNSINLKDGARRTVVSGPDQSAHLHMEEGSHQTSQDFNYGKVQAKGESTLTTHGNGHLGETIVDNSTITHTSGTVTHGHTKVVNQGSLVTDPSVTAFVADHLEVEGRSTAYLEGSSVANNKETVSKDSTLIVNAKIYYSGESDVSGVGTQKTDTSTETVIGRQTTSDGAETSLQSQRLTAREIIARNNGINNIKPEEIGHVGELTADNGKNIADRTKTVVIGEAAATGENGENILSNIDALSIDTLKSDAGATTVISFSTGVINNMVNQAQTVIGNDSRVHIVSAENTREVQVKDAEVSIEKLKNTGVIKGDKKAKIHVYMLNNKEGTIIFDPRDPKTFDKAMGPQLHIGAFDQAGIGRIDVDQLSVQMNRFTDQQQSDLLHKRGIYAGLNYNSLLVDAPEVGWKFLETMHINQNQSFDLSLRVASVDFYANYLNYGQGELYVQAVTGNIYNHGQTIYAVKPVNLISDNGKVISESLNGTAASINSSEFLGVHGAKGVDNISYFDRDTRQFYQAVLQGGTGQIMDIGVDIPLFDPTKTVGLYITSSEGAVNNIGGKFGSNGQNLIIARDGINSEAIINMWSERVTKKSHHHRSKLVTYEHTDVYSAIMDSTNGGNFLLTDGLLNATGTQFYSTNGHSYLFGAKGVSLNPVIGCERSFAKDRREMHEFSSPTSFIDRGEQAGKIYIYSTEGDVIYVNSLVQTTGAFGMGSRDGVALGLIRSLNHEVSTKSKRYGLKIGGIKILGRGKSSLPIANPISSFEGALDNFGQLGSNSDFLGNGLALYNGLGNLAEAADGVNKLVDGAAKLYSNLQALQGGAGLDSIAAGISADSLPKIEAGIQRTKTTTRWSSHPGCGIVANEILLSSHKQVRLDAYFKANRLVIDAPIFSMNGMPAFYHSSTQARGGTIGYNGAWSGGLNGADTSIYHNYTLPQIAYAKTIELNNVKEWHLTGSQILTESISGNVDVIYLKTPINETTFSSKQFSGGWGQSVNYGQQKGTSQSVDAVTGITVLNPHFQATQNLHINSIYNDGGFIDPSLIAFAKNVHQQELTLTSHISGFGVFFNGLPSFKDAYVQNLGGLQYTKKSSYQTILGIGGTFEDWKQSAFSSIQSTGNDYKTGVYFFNIANMKNTIDYYSTRIMNAFAPPVTDHPQIQRATHIAKEPLAEITSISITNQSKTKQDGPSSKIDSLLARESDAYDEEEEDKVKTIQYRLSSEFWEQAAEETGDPEKKKRYLARARGVEYLSFLVPTFSGAVERYNNNEGACAVMVDGGFELLPLLRFFKGAKRIMLGFDIGASAVEKKTGFDYLDFIIDITCNPSELAPPPNWGYHLN